MSDQNPLFHQNGQRLYLTQDERAAFINAASTADRPLRTFCGVLHHTGCRISEALNLTVKSIDLSAETIVFRTLKKRTRKPVWRAVPVPPDFLDILDMVGSLVVQVRARSEQHDINDNQIEKYNPLSK